MHVLRYAIVLVALVAAPAHAADQTILGRAFAVRDPLPGVNASKRSIVVAGRERPTDNTIVGDPLASGATLAVVALGNTGSSQTFGLPAGPYVEPPFAGWRAKVGSTSTTYKYYDKLGTNGPVRLLYVRRTSSTLKFKAIVDGKNGAVEVVPPPDGADGGARFTITGGDSYCLAFGGVAGGKVVSTPEVLKIGRPTAEACPVIP